MRNCLYMLVQAYKWVNSNHGFYQDRKNKNLSDLRRKAILKPRFNWNKEKLYSSKEFYTLKVI